MVVIQRQDVVLSGTAVYSHEGVRSDLVNSFAEYGPASLDITAGDAAPVQLAKKIFNHYVGGVSVEKEDADKICQVRFQLLSFINL